ncbi:MAG: hypothetical protein ACI4ST_02520, partial [Candidatus Gallimonas sp.]
ESVVLSGEDEFVLCYADDEQAALRLLPSSQMQFVGTETDGNALSLLFRFGKICVRVCYTAEEQVFVKRVTVTSDREFYLKRIVTESRTCNRAMSEGGEGMPAFMENTGWVGIEFPAANNVLSGNACAFYQAPFEKTKEFRSLPVVYGLDVFGDVRKTFSAYIAGKAGERKPLRVYCDWGLHDDLTESDRPVELTEKMTLENVDFLTDVMKKTGVKWDYYLMDAFWFEEDDKYLGFKARTFPHGIGPVLEKLKEAGIAFGLWFDLNCKHGKLRGMEKYSAMLAEKDILCFSCDEVAELMTEAIAYHIREHGVSMIKLDFAYFECENPAHGHSVEHTESKEKAVKNFIRMTERLKSIRPDLKILCYNGWTTSLERIGSVKKRSGHAISPYWCEYADYLYCGDPRPSEIAASSLVDSIVYYTDSLFRDFTDSYLPPCCIDDHGTMLGTTETIYRQGKKLFRQGILLNVLRGGNKLNPYGDLSELDGEDWAYYRFVDGLFEEIAERGMTSSYLAGDVRKGETYGYSVSGEGEGYLYLCNPSGQRRAASAALPCGKNVTVRLKTVIVNGKIAQGGEETLATDCWQTTLEANGYALVRWEIAREERSARPLVLTGGDTVALDTAGKSALSLAFTEIGSGDPVRTCLGYPEGLRVYETASGKPLATEISYKIWSGISWLYFRLNDAQSVTLEYSGKPIALKLDTEDGK